MSTRYAADAYKRKKCLQKELDGADIVIALGKAWKRRNRG
jgi:hypothetical protein